MERSTEISKKHMFKTLQKKHYCFMILSDHLLLCSLKMEHVNRNARQFLNILKSLEILSFLVIFDLLIKSIAREITCGINRRSAVLVPTSTSKQTASVVPLSRSALGGPTMNGILASPFLSRCMSSTSREVRTLMKIG